MKIALQVISWVGIVFGALAILGAFVSVDANGNTYTDPYALMGGLMFFTQGLFALIYISQEKISE